MDEKDIVQTNEAAAEIPNEQENVNVADSAEIVSENVSDEQETPENMQIEETAVEIHEENNEAEETAAPNEEYPNPFEDVPEECVCAEKQAEPNPAPADDPEQNVEQNNYQAPAQNPTAYNQTAYQNVNGYNNAAYYRMPNGQYVAKPPVYPQYPAYNYQQPMYNQARPNYQPQPNMQYQQGRAQYYQPNPQPVQYQPQPYGYQQAGNGGYIPPVGNVNAEIPNGQPMTVPQKKHTAGKVILWTVSIILELIIVIFAIIGMYYVCGNAMNETNGGTTSQVQSGGSTSSGVITDPTVRVQMGLTLVEMPDSLMNQFNLLDGLIIYGIDSTSNAINKGLMLSDVVTHINGKRVVTFDDVYNVLRNLNVGDMVTIKVYRVDNNNNMSDPFEVSFAVTAKTEGSTSSIPDNSSKYPAA